MAKNKKSELKQAKLFDFKNEETMISAMKKERISLTCAPGGENHAGMEIIGRMPVKGEGFTAHDVEGLGGYFINDCDFGEVWINENGNETVEVLDLNSLSGENKIGELATADQARVLLLRNWVQNTFEPNTVEDIYGELIADAWDAEYLDKNKYRTEIVDGVETKVRGKRMNKRARRNLCYVAGREQEPDVWKGKGRIVDLKKKTALNKAVDRLRSMIKEGLLSFDSKTKVEINVVEGNRYYDLKNTGIGFHGDTERVVVICISIGCDNYPMRWQWFKDSMPVGKPIDITLNCGDVYIMSEKAVGSDWKLSSLYTLRHSAGAEKYRTLKKWEKRRGAYEARLKERADRLVAKKKAKAEKLNFKVKVEKKPMKLKCKKKKVIIKSKVEKNDRANKRKTTKNGKLKAVV